MLTKFPTTGLSKEENIKSSASCYPGSRRGTRMASTIVNFWLEKCPGFGWCARFSDVLMFGNC